MRIRPIELLMVMMMVWCMSGSLRAHAGENTLYTLGVSLNQEEGVVGGWTGVGEKGAWKETVAGTILKDRLYTVETSGILYKTDLPAGSWKAIGKPEFGKTAFLFAAENALYILTTDGNLLRVNAADGSKTAVGAPGDWKNTRTGTILDNRLYTTKSNGALYATDLTTGNWKQIGNLDFGDTTAMLSANGALYTLRTDGSLYSVNLSDGSRVQIGAAQGWKQAIGRVGFHNQLITAASNGSLVVSNLTNGTRATISESEYGNTKFMFATNDNLYTIEKDGTLYRIYLQPGGGISSYDWCPQEVEKVFREQGKAFYHQIAPKQINGAQATHAGVLAGLAWLQNSATKDDLAVIYIGCHGSTNPNKGWGIVTADGKMLWGDEIKAALAKVSCQVLIVVETCTSGGFALPHKNDRPLPPNVTALCACTAAQTTDNQLDMALLEGLYGRADFNKDGVVTLDELIRYIQQRYLEWWPKPQSARDSQTPVLVKSPNLSGATPLTSVSPALAAVNYQGTLYSALLEGRDGPNYRVHMLGWSSEPGKPYFLTNQVTRDLLCLPTDGAPLLVKQGEKWSPARLLSQADGKCTVHYLGATDDDTVPINRIQYPFVGHPQGTH